jgi:hypothetical protein
MPSTTELMSGYTAYTDAHSALRDAARPEATLPTTGTMTDTVTISLSGITHAWE